MEKIILIDEQDLKLKDKLNKFLNDNNFSNYMQTLDWKELREEKEKYAVCKIIGEDIKWFSIIFKKKNDEHGEFYYSPYGPILEKYDFKNLKEYIYDIVDFLNTKNKKTNKLIINPKINEIDINVFDRLKKDLKYNIERIDKYDFKNILVSTREAVLELNLLDKEYLQRINSKTRYKIKKFEKEYEIYICNDFDLKDFMKLYKDTSKRHDFKMHDEDYFLKLKQIYKNDLICCTIKDSENETLAISLNIKYKKSIEYVYGVSSNNKRNKNPCYILHWKMINFSKKIGMDRYSFGGVYCKDLDEKNKDFGLLKFKLNFCYNGFLEYDSYLKIEWRNDEK